ncbi:MAG: TolC family protein [Akkermansiaceae bacterium]|nr:TolC family protein [Akkermansiaceae bacterium]
MLEPLTMKAVIALALQNNGDIKVNGLSKIIENEKIKAAKLAFDLQLNGSYNYQSIDSPQNAQDYVATGGGAASLTNLAQPILTQPQIFEQRNHTAKVALTQKLVTGTTLEFGTTSRVLDNTLNRRLPPSMFSPEWETFTGLTVTQPLLRDFGIAANTAEIRIAKSNAKMADFEWQSRTAQVVSAVMKAYYDVVFTLENTKVQQDSIGLAQKLMDDTMARSKEGLAATNDVSVAEAGVYQRKEDALTAEMQYVERQSALQLLFKTSSAVIAQGSRIQPVDRLSSVVPETRRAELMATAMERRYEILQADESIAIKSAQVDYATSQSRPRLDLVSSGGFHGLSGAAGRSYDRAANGQGPEWTAGVQFSMPLDWDHLQSTRRAAEEGRTQAHVQRGDTKLRVALEVDTVLSRLRTDEQRLVASRKSREAAALSADGGLKRFIEGVTTSFEVLQLQKDFARARSREYAALADLNKDVVDLQLVTGTLLDQQGVIMLGNEAKLQKFPHEQTVKIGQDRDSKDGEAEVEPVAPAPSPLKRRSMSVFKRN